MTTSPLVSGYLDALRSTADERLAPHRSAELVDEIREHIDAAIASGRPPAEVLDRLGSPAEIVAAEAPPTAPSPATGRPPAPAPRLRVREGFAVALLLIGLPLLVIGWIVGVVLLWTSDRWSTRDKLIGTLLWPGGLGAFLAVGLLPGGSTTETCDSSGSCTVVASQGASLPPWAGITVAVVLVLVPIWTSVHLVRSARVPAAG